MHQLHNKKSNLVRASTLTSEFIRDHFDVLNTAVDLRVCDHLSAISNHWSEEEKQRGRRLVKIIIESKSLPRYKVKAEPVNPGCFDENDTVISCIRWAEKNIDVVTSVDIIVVIEKFVGQTLSVEEKSRIRRNLQFLKPFTISKTGAESKRLFNSIMAMDNPKPRNIEKNLKVFKWTDLFVAVSKVLSKYSQNPSAELKEDGVLQEVSPPSTRSSHEPPDSSTDVSLFPPSGGQRPRRGSSHIFTTEEQKHESVFAPYARGENLVAEWTGSTSKEYRGPLHLPKAEAGRFWPRGIECA